MSKQSDLLKVSQDAGTTGFVNTAGDTMTGGLISPSATITDVFFPSSGYSSWKQTNYLGDLYLNNGVDRFKIDGDGRVTMPYQPAFHAQKNDAGNNNVTGNVIFNNAPQNIGGHYNTSNGRFTAPISGTYFFTVSVMKGSANGYGLYQVIKNGAVTVLPASGFVQGYTYSIANDGMTNISGSVFLNAGDYVTVFVSATYPSFYWGGYNVFSGFLVG